MCLCYIAEMHKVLYPNYKPTCKTQVKYYEQNLTLGGLHQATIPEV
ncbi:MAG TPA: hypothetical protein PKD40_05590 [Saprospiraceae bacterium]|nr:hypothetical protein [Saprospiraceae bacterium]